MSKGNQLIDKYTCQEFKTDKLNTTLIGLEPNTYFKEDFQSKRFNAVYKMFDCGENTGYRYILSVPDMI